MTGREDDVAPVEPARPLLRVVRGDPTDEELAALVTVLAALSSAGAATPAPSTAPQWSAPHRLVRRPLRAAPGGWRSSGLPH